MNKKRGIGVLLWYDELMTRDVHMVVQPLEIQSLV